MSKDATGASWGLRGPTVMAERPDGTPVETIYELDCGGVDAWVYADGPDDPQAIRVARLAARAPDMAALIREMEWCGGSCPYCAEERYTGRADPDDHLVPVIPPDHAPDCKLGRLLEAIGRAP